MLFEVRCSMPKCAKNNLSHSVMFGLIIPIHQPYNLLHGKISVKVITIMLLLGFSCMPNNIFQHYLDEINDIQEEELIFSHR